MLGPTSQLGDAVLGQGTPAAGFGVRAAAWAPAAGGGSEAGGGAVRGLQGGKADAGHAVELGFQRSPEEQVLQALGLGQRLGEAVCPFRVAVWGRLWKTEEKDC